MRRKFLIIAGIALMLAGGLSAQVTEAWVARYNDPNNSSDYGRAVAVDPSGNVYVTGYGYYTTTSYPDIITVKYDSAGVEQWVRNYNAVYGTYEYAYAIAVDASGNVYVAGYGYGANGNYDMITLKYNTSGTLQWDRLYNGSGNSSDYAYDIAVDASGNVYTAGYAYSSVSGAYNDFCVLKYNSSGTLQWAGTYNAPYSSYQYGRALAVDGSGNVYVAGYGYYNASNYDAIVAKWNSAGTFQWAANFNSPSSYSDYGYDVAVDGSGNVYLGGYTYYSSSSNPDLLAVKFNSAGVQQWARNWNGPQNSYDYGYYLKCNTAGDVWVAGYGYYSTTSSYDLELVKYNTSGTFQWAANYDGPNNSYDYMSTSGGMLAIDTADNAYICGYGYGISGNYDYETAKFDASGAFQWAMTYDGPGTSSDYGYCLAVDASNNVYITGYSYGSGTSYDYATIKYSPPPDTNPPEGRDLVCVRVIKPVGKIPKDPVTPKAVVMNNGGDIDSCYAGCKITGPGANYDENHTGGIIYLDPGEQEEVKFPDWTPLGSTGDQYKVEVTVYLWPEKTTEDDDPSNNTKAEHCIIAGGPQVDPIEIAMPRPDQVYHQMTPQATFKNVGNEPATNFYCYCEVYSMGYLTEPYIDSFAVANLDPEATQNVTFAQWACDDELGYEAKFYAATPGSPQRGLLGIEEYVQFQGVPAIAEAQDALRIEVTGPNPFVKGTLVSYAVSYPSAVTVRVYDVSGKVVRTLHDGELAGEGTLYWDGTDDAARALAGGLYFIRMITPEFSRTTKVVLVH